MCERDGSSRTSLIAAIEARSPARSTTGDEDASISLLFVCVKYFAKSRDTPSTMA